MNDEWLYNRVVSCRYDRVVREFTLLCVGRWLLAIAWKFRFASWNDVCYGRRSW